MRRVRLPLIEEPPDQGFVHRAVPLRRPDHLFHDATVAIDHEALGHPRRLVALLDVSGLVVEDVERQPQLAHERVDDRGIVLVHADGDDPEIGARELLREPLQRRHLHAARQAPRRPDVDEDRPAAVIAGAFEPTPRRASCGRRRMIRTTAKIAVVTIPVTTAHCRWVLIRPPGSAAAARLPRGRGPRSRTPRCPPRTYPPPPRAPPRSSPA